MEILNFKLDLSKMFPWFMVILTSKTHSRIRTAASPTLFTSRYLMITCSSIWWCVWDKNPKKNFSKEGRNMNTNAFSNVVTYKNCKSAFQDDYCTLKCRTSPSYLTIIKWKLFDVEYFPTQGYSFTFCKFIKKHTIWIFRVCCLEYYTISRN